MLIWFFAYIYSIDLIDHCIPCLPIIRVRVGVVSITSSFENEGELLALLLDRHLLVVVEPLSCHRRAPLLSCSLLAGLVTKSMLCSL
jgi:hypothetical protein